VLQREYERKARTVEGRTGSDGLGKWRGRSLLFLGFIRWVEGLGWMYLWDPVVNIFSYLKTQNSLYIYKIIQDQNTNLFESVTPSSS
jgi:hypothetical protein